MTKTQKKTFIKELIGNVRTELLGKVQIVPEEWDGHELRAWIADKFADAAMMSECMRDKRSRRRRVYENEVAVRNL